MNKPTIFAHIDASEIKEISITGKRWTDSAGNTYHSVSVAALVPVAVADRVNGNQYGKTCGDVWIDLAFDWMVYGYERHFEFTALELLAQAVNRPEWAKEYRYICQAAAALNVPYSENVYDVRRKKDL